MIWLLCWPGFALAAAPLVIGSKNFTESVILGELLRLQAASHGIPVEHRRALGGPPSSGRPCSTDASMPTPSTPEP